MEMNAKEKKKFASLSNGEKARYLAWARANSPADHWSALCGGDWRGVSETPAKPPVLSAIANYQRPAALTPPPMKAAPSASQAVKSAVTFGPKITDEDQAAFVRVFNKYPNTSDKDILRDESFNAYIRNILPEERAEFAMAVAQFRADCVDKEERFITRLPKFCASGWKKINIMQTLAHQVQRAFRELAPKSEAGFIDESGVRQMPKTPKGERLSARELAEWLIWQDQKIAEFRSPDGIARWRAKLEKQYQDFLSGANESPLPTFEAWAERYGFEVATTQHYTATRVTADQVLAEMTKPPPAPTPYSVDDDMPSFV